MFESEVFLGEGNSFLSWSLSANSTLIDVPRKHRVVDEVFDVAQIYTNCFFIAPQLQDTGYH